MAFTTVAAKWQALMKSAMSDTFAVECEVGGIRKEIRKALTNHLYCNGKRGKMQEGFVRQLSTMKA